MKLAAPILLVVVGLLQMIGDLTGLTALKGVGAATGASPAPKVFSSVQGLETFSTRFEIELEEKIDELRVRPRSFAVTPELYSRLRGPYNRRNVYGAAFAYAPVLPKELLDPVMRHALCGDAPLLRELGIASENPGAAPWIVLHPVPAPSPGGEVVVRQLRYRAPCR